MKKKSYLVPMLGLLLLLTACGNVQSASPSSPATPSSASPVETDQSSPSDAPGGASSDAFAFVVPNAENYAVHINDDMKDVLEALGEPQSYFEAASCAFDGLDKMYTYPGFMITTRPEETGDFVNLIQLTDDSVTTAEGIYIGSSAEDVTAAYGTSEPDGNTLQYSKGDSHLYFILEDGKVLSIEYAAD